MCVGVDVREWERKSRCEGTAITAGQGLVDGHERTAPRSGTLFPILCFLASRQATATAHTCPLGFRAGGSSVDHSTATSPLPIQSLLPNHRPLAPQSLAGPYLLVVDRPAIMPAPEDALQLHPFFVSAVEGAGDCRAYWRALALVLRPPIIWRRAMDLLNYGGASGEGPDTAKAEGRRV